MFAARAAPGSPETPDAEPPEPVPPEPVPPEPTPPEPAPLEPLPPAPAPPDPLPPASDAGVTRPDDTGDDTGEAPTADGPAPPPPELPAPDACRFSVTPGDADASGEGSGEGAAEEDGGDDTAGLLPPGEGLPLPTPGPGPAPGPVAPALGETAAEEDGRGVGPVVPEADGPGVTPGALVVVPEAVADEVPPGVETPSGAPGSDVLGVRVASTWLAGLLSSPGPGSGSQGAPALPERRVPTMTAA